MKKARQPGEAVHRGAAQKRLEGVLTMKPEGSSRRNLRLKLMWFAAAALVVIIAIVLDFWTAVVFALFALAFLLDVSPVIPFAIALLLLVGCPLMVLIEQNTAVELLASWSYCFLAIGVVLQLFRYLKGAPAQDKEG